MEILKYFNPFGNEFKKAAHDFKELSGKYRVLTGLVTALIALPTFLIGGIPAFCLLVGRFKKLQQEELNPATARTKEIADKVFSKDASQHSTSSQDQPTEVFDEVKEQEIPKVEEVGRPVLEVSNSFPPQMDVANLKYTLKRIEDLPEEPIERKLTEEEQNLFSGSTISFKTQMDLIRLQNDIGILLPKMQLSETVDGGDCFFDAFAQGLSPILGREVTIQELRKIVSNYANTSKDIQWTQTELGADYIEWRERVHLNEEQSKLERKVKPPVWGNPLVDGYILANHFKVNLRIISEAGERDYAEKPALKTPKETITTFETSDEEEDYDFDFEDEVIEEDAESEKKEEKMSDYFRVFDEYTLVPNGQNLDAPTVHIGHVSLHFLAIVPKK